ncbi:MAG: UDP-N-acetylglucosamine 1-carboxyvinyltransferase [Chloroflexi bacterium]|nr:UDP-N-acetylglucosamine 1-carboxyvinyltransferase [Chloroflexota bacterium]
MVGDRFVIEGGHRLEGVVRISGAKNAALPAIAAALLTSDDCILEDVPDIEDVAVMSEVLRRLGATVEWLGQGRVRINAARIHTLAAPSELVVRNRASFVVMGPLLGRFGEAACCPPGGDVIGERPLDVHLAGFRALGATISRFEDKYRAQAPRLQGTRIFLDYPSVLGTENILLAACMAHGRTVVCNAAAEPEVSFLAGMLNSMGARITGAGSNIIEIEGVPELHGTTTTVIPDRIEAGTFACAAAISCGEVVLENVVPRHLDALIWKLREAGAVIEVGERTLQVRPSRDLQGVTVQALPYPGFATDLQSVFGALLTQAHGMSIIHERVYDNRLLYVGELRKMGANVVVAGQTAIINGPTSLAGAAVRALDIRSGAAVVLAGLAAHGVTDVGDVYHLDRGYEHFAEKLQGLGAHIRRVSSKAQLTSPTR